MHISKTLKTWPLNFSKSAKSMHFTYILNIDIDVAIFWKYRINIVSKLKKWYLSITRHNFIPWRSAYVIIIAWQWLSRCVCLCVYTVGHKTWHFVLLITLAFLRRFLYFVYQWKQEGILYKGVNTVYHITLTVSPHYLVKLQTTLKTALFVVNHLSAVVRNFHKESSSVRLIQFLVGNSFIGLLSENLSHSHKFW